MFFLRILTPFLLINTVKSDAFGVSSQSGNASGAASLCNLATPTYYETGDKYEMTVNVSYNGPLWVGYMETAFSYIGCASANKLPCLPINITNPSECYRKCNSKYIGIDSHSNKVHWTCYCIQNLTELFNTCDEICVLPSGTLCGGTNFASIYERVDYPKTITNSGMDNIQTILNSLVSVGPKHCLAYEPTHRLFFWSACNSSYRSVCQTANGTLINDTLTSGTWMDVMKHCLQTSMFPVPPTKNFSSIATEGGQLWTSNIRSFSTCGPKSNHCRDRHGYIEQNTNSTNGVYILKFGFNDSLHALCERASSGNECTVSTSKHQAATTAGTTNAYNTTVIITTSSNASTVSSGEGSTTGQHATVVSTNSTSTSSIVGVYVAVPLTFILIVAVIGLMLWRRRTRFLSEKWTKKEPVINGGILNDDLGAAISNSAYEGNAAVRHDYFVLEPTNEYAAIKDTDIAQSSNDEEYNTTTTVHAKANGDLGTGNIYNRLDEVTDDTYNHCEKITLVSDETYSHIEGGYKFGPASGLHDITSVGTNDTYSHMSTKTPPGNTALVKQEKAQRDAGEDDETYNHTGAFNAKSPAKAFKPDCSRKPVAQSMDKKHSKDDNGRPNYDYAYATKAKEKKAKMQEMFTLSQLPNSGDYDFAKEPQATAPGYELEKPTPVYMELCTE